MSRPIADGPLIKWAIRILNWVGAAAVVAIAVHIAIDIFARVAFNSPIPGTLEVVSNWYMIAAVFIGAWAAQRRNEHISVDIITARLPEASQAIVAVLASLVTLVFLVALIWLGLIEAFHNASIGEYIGAYRVPIWPARLLVPIGLCAYLVLLVFDTFQLVVRAFVMPGEQPSANGDAQ